jgi:AcrR family transcriptional regulator
MAEGYAPNGLPPLPPPLAAAFAAATSGGGKRERTQSALVRAAVAVFSLRGVAAATIQEVAQVAGMTTGTVYNHFTSKEVLLERVGIVLAQSLSQAIAASQADVTDGAERVVIGLRRYILLAEESPAWVLLLLEIAAANPALLQHIETYPLADLALALRQKRVSIPNETVALDLLEGFGMQAMRRVALGQAPAGHDIAAATLVLRALGMDPAEATAVASRPLPPLPMPQAPAKAASNRTAAKSSR